MTDAQLIELKRMHLRTVVLEFKRDCEAAVIRMVVAAAEADAQVRGLQRVIEADRK